MTCTMPISISEETAAEDEPGSPASADDPPEPDPVAFTLRDATRRLPEPAAQWLRTQFSAAIAATGAAIDRIGIEIIDDDAMSALHARHLDDPTTTDVLTFAVSAPDEPVDVDIAVCLDEAERQATGRGHPIERELLLYALHGVLHTLGYDDHDDEAFHRMHAEEDRILEAIGVGRTFGREDTR